MLSEEELADIVRDEIDSKLEKGELRTYYYILLDGKIYPTNKYDKEVEEGKRSPNDIYARVGILFSFINYLDTVSVKDIIVTYLRKAGYKIKYSSGVLYPGYKIDVLYPTPSLKYYVSADIKENDTEPEYLVISIYDIDTLARALYVPQIAEQKLGSKPREILEDDVNDIYEEVVYKQPLLAGHTLYEAYRILEDYYVYHEEKYKDEAYKIGLAYLKLLPRPYQVC